MYATVRNYEGIDGLRSEEETSTVGTRPLSALRKLPGFSGCYVFANEHPETLRTVQGGSHDSAAA